MSRLEPEIRPPTWPSPDGDFRTIPCARDSSGWWSTPEQEYFSGLLGEQIMAAIATLPEAFRTTILLVNVEGLTYDEAAEALGVPRGTIRSRMKRGRTMLQKSLWLQARDAGLVAVQSKCLKMEHGRLICSKE